MPQLRRACSISFAILSAASATAGLLTAAPASAQCGTGGSCFETHGPGCSTSDCCAAVCAADAFCCANSWDEICVIEANNFCVSAAVAGPFYEPYSGNAYYILDPGTWQTLQNAAVALGGHLVTIHSVPENEWVTNTVLAAGYPANFFIGLSDTGVEGQFAWVDGSVNNISFWSSGQPDNFGGAEDCVQIWTAAGNWNDLPPTAVRIGVAEIEVTFCGDFEAGGCLSSHGPHCDDADCCSAICAFDSYCCSAAWDNICVNEALAGCQAFEQSGRMIEPSTGRRFELLNTSYWQAAHAKAGQLGATLATVEEGQTNEFLRRWFAQGVPGLGAGPVWTGANDIESEGTFTWVSGAPVAFNRWAKGEPGSDPGQDVVAVLPDSGEWMVYGIDVPQYAVIEFGSDACGGAGSCYVAHDTTGCEIESCCNVVCAIDPFCCGNHWDALCADEGNAMCEPEVLLGPIVNPANGHTYCALESGSWSEAERVANAMGGHLAVPNDEAENAWIAANLVAVLPGLGECLLGVHDQLKEGAFQSVETTLPISFAAWAIGEPNDVFNDDVVALGPNGLWNTVWTYGTRPAVIEVPCVGDIDASGDVAAADIAILLGAWGRNPGPSDLNADGDVNATDLALLLGAWGACGTNDCCSAHGG